MAISADHRWRTEVLARALQRAQPEAGEPFACPYLPGRVARHVVLGAHFEQPGLYHALMDLNFRRVGSVVYRPQCDSCRECRSLRIPVAEFRPNRAQRRCLARNADVRIATAAPDADPEKHDLYRRYLDRRHDGQMEGSWSEFTRFLYDAPPTTLEATFRARDRLIGAAVVDVEPEALSAVYVYFDPDEARRSPGTLAILWLIEESRRRGVPYLYLGYHVAESRVMAYKARFRPHEVLGVDGAWRRM